MKLAVKTTIFKLPSYNREAKTRKKLSENLKFCEEVEKIERAERKTALKKFK